MSIEAERARVMPSTYVATLRFTKGKINVRIEKTNVQKMGWRNFLYISFRKLN